MQIKVLITGSAGFIGYSLALKLLKKKITVIGIDNLNTYYDIRLKKDRLGILKKFNHYTHYKVNIDNIKSLEKIFKKHDFRIVINLAAQAGVRHSLKKPLDYINSNISGFFNIIYLSQKFKINKFIYASSSSVYGNQKNFPIKINSNTIKPLSLYAATKMSNELIAYSFSNMYGIQTIGLRFFTVYGPYGRPDMSLFKFTKNILENKKIELYNNGDHYRDFTFIDDVVDAVALIIKKKKYNNIFKIYNIANSNSISLITYLSEIEKNLNKKATIKKLSMQKGDVKKTHADISALKKELNFSPKIDYKNGIKKFINWYKRYYGY